MNATNWKRWLTFLALVAVSVVFQEQLLWACPTCQDAVAQNDPTSRGMVAGFFWSILFMLSMPFLILTGLSTYFYLLVRQARTQQATATTSVQNAGREYAETRPQ